MAQCATETEDRRRLLFVLRGIVEALADTVLTDRQATTIGAAAFCGLDRVRNGANCGALWRMAEESID